MSKKVMENTYWESQIYTWSYANTLLYQKSQNFDTKPFITGHEIHQEVSSEPFHTHPSQIFYLQKCTTQQHQEEPRKQAQTSGHLPVSVHEPHGRVRNMWPHSLQAYSQLASRAHRGWRQFDRTIGLEGL